MRIDADGFFYFVGRLGSMIKTAGANVSAAEVEKAIAKVTGGTVAYVVGIPDAERGQLVAAVVSVPDGATHSTRRRCASGSRRNCRRTRSPSGSSPCHTPKYRCCPAARSTCSNWGSCSMPDRHHRPTGAVSRRPARRQADGDRSRRAASAIANSTPPQTIWPRRSSKPASARAPGSG